MGYGHILNVKKYYGALHLCDNVDNYSTNIVVRCTFPEPGKQQSCLIFVEISQTKAILGAAHRNRLTNRSFIFIRLI
jgi:hypothetical protein